MGTYYIWTVGCQMNLADSQRLAGQLERLGYCSVASPEDADIVVVNSCVVRQHAEDRVANKLASLKPLKKGAPDKVIALMGCMVGPSVDSLKRRFSHVDIFVEPQVFDPILELAEARPPQLSCQEPGPVIPQVMGPTAFVPIIQGCDHFCTFCIVPYRRGREKSRPMAEILQEVEALAAQGVKEVTLLGQKVDSYGHDLFYPDKHINSSYPTNQISRPMSSNGVQNPDLADLLEVLNQVPGLERIRFLTSFPTGVTDKIIGAVARLDKVCEHINIPVQAGSDNILGAMRRGYTVAQYREIIDKIKGGIPGVALSTDIIVGFPGETEGQFEMTCRLLEEVEYDKVHVAAYSPRPGTIAARTLPDDVPQPVKQRRLKAVEELQEGIAGRLNARLLGQEVEVLVEGRKDGKWEGRTRTNKLVFFLRTAESDFGPAGATDLLGELVTVRIDRTSPWSLQGELVGAGIGAVEARKTGARLKR